MSEQEHIDRAPTDSGGEAARLREGVTDAFYTLDSEWRFTYVNAQAERLLMRAREDLLGRSVWEVFPEAVDSTFDRLSRRAVAEQAVASVEEFYPPFGAWLEVRVYPSPSGLSVFFQDVTVRKRNEEALRESEERYRLLVEGAKDYAMILLDAEGRVTGWNAGAERIIMGWGEGEVLGRSAALIFTPEDREQGIPAQELQTAAAQGRAMDLRWHLKKDGSRFFADGILEALPGPEGTPRGFAKILRDATDTKRAQEALHAFEESLRDAQARLETALAAGGIATWTWDLVNERIVADERLARLVSLPSEDAAGGPFGVYLQAVHPDDRAAVEEALRDAINHREAYEVEHRVADSDGAHRWLAARGRVERDAEGRAVALTGVVVDITEQAERRRRERFLADLAERARGLTDPEELISDAVRSVGEFLGVSRCVFADIDIEADTCTVLPDYRADGSVVSIAGTFPISAFGAFVVQEYMAGRTAVVDDVRTDPLKAPPESLPAYEAIGVRSYVAAPVMHSARLVSAIAVHSAIPRRWKPEEVELIQTVVERAWLTVEVLRQGRALVREAAAMARLLESITDAFMVFDSEWRFTFVNDRSEQIMGRKREDLLGRRFWDEFPAAVGTVFEREYRRAVDEQVSVAFEQFYPPLNVWVEVRAYPSADGLSVFYQDISERKALERERERLSERERNIATQLQTALQPDLPGAVPGLALARYYEAALAEAGVGGDFYDVFALDKGCTALVVGDLSGKGLAAAAQVATVRNMLRAFAYTKPTLAEAVSELNGVLADNGLLTGFTTLFIGAYDSGTGALTYVNCGQEPALVRRAATGAVEPLPPTGPVLGSFEGAAYEGQSVKLRPGDALAVFTDGLTEVGRSRLEMLGIGGVASLLGQPFDLEEAADAGTVAECLALRLIKGVDRAADGGVMRDDVCLLVAVAE